jgi:hypothetical protein
LLTIGIMPCTFATSSSDPCDCSNVFQTSSRATRCAGIHELHASARAPTDTNLALETLALQVPVRTAEHLSRKLGVARRGRRLRVLILLLVLALRAQDWDRLGLEERVRDPDLDVPAEGDETLVQRARAFALALFDLEVDVRLPEELGH